MLQFFQADRCHLNIKNYNATLSDKTITFGYREGTIVTVNILKDNNRKLMKKYRNILERL